MEILAIIIAGIVGYIIFLRFYIRAKGGLRNEPTYKHGVMKGNASKLSQGVKPWGKPMAGSAQGASFFHNTQQLIDNGLGLKVGTPIRYDRLWLGGHATTSLKNKENILAGLYAPDEGHLLTIAPTRRGKGTCHIIPNLLSYQGSVVVNDIKGETSAITARQRATLGTNVFRFAPYEAESAHWNPLDFIQTGEDAWEDAALITELLIAPRPNSDDFWNDIGKNFLRGVILHVALSRSPAKRNMTEVRELLTDNATAFQATVDEMTASDNALVRRAANAFQNADGKVQSGLITTLDSHLGVWDSPRLAEITDRSDFDFLDLNTRFTSVYFCIPPERLSAYAPVLRLFFGIAVSSMTRDNSEPTFPVTFFLDEFPQLGRMKPIEDSMAYLAGYGVRLWLFTQDLNQLKSTYGEMTHSIIANCACKSFFGTSDPETAKLISNMCGDMTVHVANVGASQSADGWRLPSVNESIGSISRPLMAPDEIMALPDTEQLIFYQGLHPVLAEKTPYFQMAELIGTYDDWKREGNPKKKRGEAKPAKRKPSKPRWAKKNQSTQKPKNQTKQKRASEVPKPPPFD